MASVWGADRGRRFYAGFGLFGLAAIALGFSTTYFVPIARGMFRAPPVVHVHGLAALSWVCLLTVQAVLAMRGRTRLHMRLGEVGLPLALLVWASGIMTSAWAARRDLPAQGAVAEVSFFGTVTGLSIFVLFVGAGYISRRNPPAHKRWMLLATIAVLWPAVFRWRHVLPAMERPDIILGLFVADLPILIAMVRDRVRFGAVHPVWLTGGLFWFVEQGIETAVFDTQWSAPIGHALLTILP